MTDGLERIGLHLPSLILYTINFAILTTVLYAIAFRPMLTGIRRRTQERAQAESLLEQAEMEAGNQRETSRTLVAEARDEAATIIDVAMRQARLESQAAMERGLAQARARAEADLHAQRDRLHAESAALAVAAAERVLVQALGTGTQQALIESGLREIANTKLEAPATPQGLISVTSAVALTAAEWSGVGDALHSLVGDYSAAVHHVRPEVLGGLAVQVGNTIIDATLLGKLSQLHAELAAAEVDPTD